MVVSLIKPLDNFSWDATQEEQWCSKHSWSQVTLECRKVLSEKSDPSANMTFSQAVPAPLWEAKRLAETGSIDAILPMYRKTHNALCSYVHRRNWTSAMFLAFWTKPGFACSFSPIFGTHPGCGFIFLAFLMPKGLSPLSPPVFHLYWKQYLAKPLSACYFIPEWICLWFLPCKTIGGTATACALGFQGAPGVALAYGYQSSRIRWAEIWL